MCHYGQEFNAGEPRTRGRTRRSVSLARSRRRRASAGLGARAERENAARACEYPALPGDLYRRAVSFELDLARSRGHLPRRSSLQPLEERRTSSRTLPTYHAGRIAEGESSL